MQTKITFDKCYILGKKRQDLENDIINKKSYLPIVTTELKIECIGDLEKEFKDRDARNHTSSLCSKLQLFPVAKYDHMTFVRQELLEDIAIEQKHDFFNYVTADYLSSRGLTKDLYSDSGKDQQIQLWATKCFESDIVEELSSIPNSNGYAIAQHYRKYARGKNGYISNDLKNDSLIFKTPETIIEIVKNIRFNGSPTVDVKGFVDWIEAKNVIKLPVNIKEFLAGRMQNRSLCEYAPYTAYVYTITLLRCFNFPHNKKIPKKLNEPDSDSIDVNYILYFPFIDCFASRDKFFNAFFKEFKQFQKILLLSE